MRSPALGTVFVLTAIAFAACGESHSRDELVDACRRSNMRRLELGASFHAGYADAFCSAIARIAARTACQYEAIALFECGAASSTLEGDPCQEEAEAFYGCIEDAGTDPCVTTCQARVIAGCARPGTDCSVGCGATETIGVFGSCESVVSAWSACEASQPDVCSLDSCLPEREALQRCAEDGCASDPGASHCGT